jgi:putative membrane protein
VRPLALLHPRDSVRAVMTDDDKLVFDAQPNVSNHFAWLRTQLGLQRTLMAAVRTSVSLIGFGFTVAQFFQHMQGTTKEGLLVSEELPRNLGLVLIAAGVISLLVFTWQYRNATEYLRTGSFSVLTFGQTKPMHLSTYFIAFVVMGIGVAAFISVFLRF